MVYNTSVAHVGKQIQCRCGRRVPVEQPPNAEPREATARSTKRTSSRRATSESPPARRWRMPELSAARRVTQRWWNAALNELRSRRPMVRWTARAAWAWSALVLLSWVLLAAASERFLPATLLAYGPRFLMLAPFAVLLPVALVLARRALLPLCAALLLLVGPIMGGRVALRTLGRAMPATPPAGTIRVLSFNAQGGRGAAFRIRDYIEDTRPDLIAVQECGEELWRSLEAIDGWYRSRHESLCTASRWPIESLDSMPRADFERIAQFGYGGTGLAVRHVLRSPRGPFVFVNLHLETPRRGLDALLGDQGLVPDKIGSARDAYTAPSGDVARGIELNAAIRDRENERAAIWSIKGDKRVPSVIAGDFNLPVESTIYRRHWSAFTDAFEAAGNGFGWSKREGRLLRVRIDHILTTDASPKPVGAWVGPDIGSDHRPVLADLKWANP